MKPQHALQPPLPQYVRGLGGLREHTTLTCVRSCSTPTVSFAGFEFSAASITSQASAVVDAGIAASGDSVWSQVFGQALRLSQLTASQPSSQPSSQHDAGHPRALSVSSSVGSDPAVRPIDGVELSLGDSEAGESDGDSVDHDALDILALSQEPPVSDEPVVVRPLASPPRDITRGVASKRRRPLGSSVPTVTPTVPTKRPRPAVASHHDAKLAASLPSPSRAQPHGQRTPRASRGSLPARNRGSTHRVRRSRSSSTCSTCSSRSLAESAISTLSGSASSRTCSTCSRHRSRSLSSGSASTSLSTACSCCSCASSLSALSEYTDNDTSGREQQTHLEMVRTRDDVPEPLPSQGVAWGGSSRADAAAMVIADSPRAVHDTPAAVQGGGTPVGRVSNDAQVAHGQTTGQLEGGGDGAGVGVSTSNASEVTHLVSPSQRDSGDQVDCHGAHDGVGDLQGFSADASIAWNDSAGDKHPHSNVFKFGQAPPSARDLKDSMGAYNMLEIPVRQLGSACIPGCRLSNTYLHQPQAAFYSNAHDKPPRVLVFGGVEHRVLSTCVSDLPRFDTQPTRQQFRQILAAQMASFPLVSDVTSSSRSLPATQERVALSASAPVVSGSQFSSHSLRQAAGSVSRTQDPLSAPAQPIARRALHSVATRRPSALALCGSGDFTTVDAPVAVPVFQRLACLAHGDKACNRRVVTFHKPPPSLSTAREWLVADKARRRRVTVRKLGIARRLAHKFDSNCGRLLPAGSGTAAYSQDSASGRGSSDGVTAVTPAGTYVESRTAPSNGAAGPVSTTGGSGAAVAPSSGSGSATPSSAGRTTGELQGVVARCRCLCRCVRWSRACAMQDGER